jgi:uncharacterized protein YacL (UPF0231 family)
MHYPTTNNMNEGRFRELLIAKDFAMKQYDSTLDVKLGNDQLGIPDSFFFKDEKLIACVELVGYTLGKINEIKSHTQVGDFTFNIDISKSTKIHTRQPHPFTLIDKKIRGSRKYKRFGDESLILLIHTEVYVKNNKLCFAMDGIMQLNPSVNNFMHHKNTIITELKKVASEVNEIQWDAIYLVDYSYSSIIESCPLIKIY